MRINEFAIPYNGDGFTENDKIAWVTFGLVGDDEVARAGDADWFKAPRGHIIVDLRKKKKKKKKKYTVTAKEYFNIALRHTEKTAIHAHLEENYYPAGLIFTKNLSIETKISQSDRIQFILNEKILHSYNCYDKQVKDYHFWLSADSCYRLLEAGYDNIAAKQNYKSSFSIKNKIKDAVLLENSKNLLFTIRENKNLSIFHSDFIEENETIEIPEELIVGLIEIIERYS